MRREMDQLLGDFWDQAGSKQRRQIAAFVPRVDVYYCGEAAHEDGVLRVELPVRLPQAARQVPIERAE